MAGSRTGAADLTTRLNKGNIHHIFELINNSYTTDYVLSEYDISYSSLVRILQPWNWTNAQRHHWDYDNLPELIWPEDTKRPKGTYPPGDPMPETKSSKKTVFRQKNTEYESGSKDAKAYLDAENNDEPPHVGDCAVIALGDNDVPHSLNEQAESFRKAADDLGLIDKLPELDHLFPTPRDRINRKELMHRLESVECCFELMAEEFNKLKVFLKE